VGGDARACAQASPFAGCTGERGRRLIPLRTINTTACRPCRGLVLWGGAIRWFAFGHLQCAPVRCAAQNGNCRKNTSEKYTG
jgi:hypothetical protein